MYFKVTIAVTCLVAVVSCAVAPKRQPQPFEAASQVVSQSVNAPAGVDPKIAQQQAKLHYVEIGPSLKGDYKFGYDTGSGPAGQSFREETRLDDGTVKGAYGYIDANGKQRIVKYTAGKAGFVVESDQEAGNQQGGNSQGAPAQAQPQAPQQQQAPAHLQRVPQPVHRPQPVAAPVRESAVSFDEPAAAPISRQAAEQQHAQQLRQHQLAQQQAIAQQQQVLQQQQLAAQQLAAQQQAAQPARAPAQVQPSFSGHPQQPQQQGQPQQPSQVHHFNQNGHFFSSSNDANINQLIMSQLNQLSGQQQPQQPQALPRQPAFDPTAFHPQAPQGHQQQQQQFPGASGVPTDFNHQVRAQRQPQQFGADPSQGQPQQVASPQAALIALHQQQQHDAQILANLRQQQIAQLEQQQRATASRPESAGQQLPPAQSFQPQPQPQAQPQFQPQPQQQQFAPQPQPQQFQPQPLASQHQPQHHQPAPTGPAVNPGQQQPAAAVQPEAFGPPVIDIRTLNYSIGQQTRVN